MQYIPSWRWACKIYKHF